MTVEPAPDLGVLVDGGVVENGMDGRTGGRSGLDRVEEADEFLMAMTLHVAADDRAVEDVPVHDSLCAFAELLYGPVGDITRCINVKTGLVSHWERGEKRPRGASLRHMTPVTKNGLGAVA